MTATQFTAWLDGYLTALKVAPSEEDMILIREKLATVSQSEYTWPRTVATPGPILTLNTDNPTNPLWNQIT